MCLCACVWARCSMRTVQGAGKSTLLNALLNESKLIPTNAMRACTVQTVPPVGRPRRSLRCADVRCGAVRRRRRSSRSGTASRVTGSRTMTRCSVCCILCTALPRVIRSQRLTLVTANGTHWGPEGQQKMTTGDYSVIAPTVCTAGRREYVSEVQGRGDLHIPRRPLRRARCAHSGSAHGRRVRRSIPSV